MGSMINFMGCLFFTTIGGSVFLAMWLLLRGLAERQGCLALLYRALWFVTFSFLLPVVYFCFWLRARMVGGVGAPVLWHTPSISAVGKILWSVWLCGASVLLAYFSLDYLRCLYHRRRGIRCGGMKREVFGRI